MRRHIAGRAEIVDAADQPAAEEMMPDAIGDHTRRERVLLAGQPLGEFEPAALVRVDLRRVWHIEQRQEAARREWAEFLRLAADADLRIADGLRVADAERGVAIRRRI